jgi:hypothetical protein
MSKRPIRVTLIMHSTRSDNLGVGALTVSEVEILRRSPRGRAPDRDHGDGLERCAHPMSAGPDIRVVDMDSKTILNPFGYFATALRSDLVIDIGAATALPISMALAG